MNQQPTAAPRVRVGDIASMRPGWHRRVIVGQTPVLVSMETDGLFAIADACPHHGVSLAEGKRRGRYMECPWHTWLIDIRTGECMHNPRIANRTFVVEIHDGHVDVVGDPDLDAPA